MQARAAGYALAGAWSPSKGILRIGRAGARASGRKGRLPERIDADLVALAIPEGELSELAANLVGRLSPRAVPFHLAGSIGLQPLRALAEAGFEVGSLHPFCSVSDATATLRGASCTIDGSPRARRELRRLAVALGLRPFARPPSDRPRYHLSAGLQIAAALAAASRAETTLVGAGLTLAEARRALAGFLRSIAGNLERLGPLASLSGPLARGERHRLNAHLALLAEDEPARQLYEAAVNILIPPKPEKSGKR
jgi:predicted short-subunit dehydrogenase-like oxidoreductase (DUF2520 family)